MTLTDETPADTEPVVTAEMITQIAQDVWGSFLDMQLDPAPAELGPSGRTLTGCVTVSGEWQGSVFLECTAAHAQAAAEAMFAADPGSLSDDEVGDALGELTNMVGGNVKSLLPAPSRLSIPSVATGEGITVRVPGATLVDTVVLVCAAGPVSISVWKV